MKKLTYLLTLMLLVFAFQAKAELQTDQQQMNDLYALPSVSTEMISDVDKLERSKENETHGTVEFEGVQEQPTNLGSLFTHYMHQSPIAYDPVSGQVIFVTIEWSDLGGSSALPMMIYQTDNMGQSWKKDSAMAYGGMGAFTPSISITNNVDATNYDDLPFTLLGRYCIQDPERGFTNLEQGIVYAFHSNGEMTEEIQDAPEDNNAGDQYWNTMKLDSYYDNDESETYGACVLQNTESGQYGVYGFLALNNMDEEMFVSEIPVGLNAAFRQSDIITSTYNGPIETDVDDMGNVYIGVNNMFADDPDNRVPGVTKSDDFGESWGEFNRMPTTIYDVYAEAKGYSNLFVWQPYRSFGFIVHDEDKYSFFFTVVLTNTQDVEATHLVEAMYDGTRWSMNTVAEGLNPEPPAAFFQSETHRQDDWADQTIWRLGQNTRAYEIQAAKTEDGNNVIVKWINYSREVTFPNPVTITMLDDNGNEQDTQLDGWYSSDIFFAYRDAGNMNWSGAINVTDSENHYKTTWIPEVVPSLTQIPIIYHSNARYQDDDVPFMSVPYIIREHIVYFWDFIQYGNADLMGSSVIENNVEYDFRLNDIVPNPASEIAEIPYVLNQSANVKIEVFSAMGEKVAELVNEYQPAGANVVSFDVSTISSGSYYVTLTIGGQRATKMLNVVK